MKRIEVFEFDNYREYLKTRIEFSDQQRPGIRSLWAKAMGCKVSFISHVLSGEYNFSPEHSEALGRFLGFTEEEADYFMLLVMRERAGTYHLKEYYSRKIEDSIERRKKRQLLMRIGHMLDSDEQAVYGSNLIYPVIHMMLTVPQFQTSFDKIAERLHISLAQVREVVDFLLARGFVKHEEGVYVSLKKHITLDKNAPNYLHQKAQWRLKAAESIYRQKSENMHANFVLAISRNDFQKIREVLVRAIEESSAIVDPSVEETVCSLCIDFFEI